MIEESSFKKLSILLIVGALLTASFFIIRPIFLSIVTGLLLAYICHPLYKKLLIVVREKNITALILVFLVLLLIFLPLWFLLPLLLKQLVNLYFYLQKVDFSNFIEMLIPAYQDYSTTIFSSLKSFIADMASKSLGAISGLVLDLPNLLLKAVVIIFIFFYGLRDGEALVEYLKSISPLSSSLDKEAIQKFKDITNSVLYGHVLVGVIQGLLTGIGLFVFGIPQPLFFTIVAIFLSVIPVVGAWLVWIPASIYLLISGKTIFGIIFLIYGSVVISWIDNVLRSYIVARRTNMSSAIIFIGMIGGMIVFGILGLILGPLILAYLLIILEIYRRKKSASAL